MKKVVKCLYWFDMGIFPGTVCFSCGFSYEEIMKEFSKKKAFGWDIALSTDKQLIESGNWFGLKRVMENKKTGKEIEFYYIILKNTFTFSDEDFIKLSHEVLHICQFFLPDILNRDKETEAEAYLHTYLMRKCVAALRGKKEAG